MKTLLLSLLLISCIALKAQPVLSSAITPLVGQTESFFVHDTTGVWPGPSGANQTWNFNLNSGSQQSITYISAAGTPYASSFPFAGAAVTQLGVYLYYETLPGNFDYYGYSNGSSQMIYSDPETMLVGPFQYQELSQDICSATFSYVGGISGSRTGTTDKYYDAYGTLVINGNTHTNVARIFIEQNLTDSSNTGIQFRHIENFIWFDGNSMNKLLEISTEYNVNNAIVVKTVKSYSVSTGIKENNSVSELSISSTPDGPSKHHLQFSATEKKNLSIEIFNINGSLIHTSNIESFTGINHFEFSMMDEAPGMYLLKVSDNSLTSLRSLKFLVH